LSYAGTLAALGALTVAIIEAWKKLRDSQAKFHRSSVLRWFQNEGGSKSKRHYFVQSSAGAATGDALPKFDPGQAFDQLLLLTTGIGRVAASSRRRYESSVDLDRRTFHVGVFYRSIEYALFELEIDRLMGQIQDAADVALNNLRIPAKPITDSG
jgi:hypothetical protein